VALVKDMATGEQRTVARPDLASTLCKHYGSIT